MGSGYTRLTSVVLVIASLQGPTAHANLALIATATAAPRKVPGQDRVSRLEHARELLGGEYRRSVVRVGESVHDIHDFVTRKVAGSLKGDWKRHAPRIARTIVREAERYGLDPVFLVAVIKTESSFDPNIVGRHGEIGLMQIKPSTAEWVARKYRFPWRAAYRLRNPVVNIKIGAAYFAMLREQLDSHGQLYLSAYNMGPGNVRSAVERQVMPSEYAARVMTRYVNLYRELGSTRLASAR
jgi:soluble lytic murein transglycosylase